MGTGSMHESREILGYVGYGPCTENVGEKGQWLDPCP